MSTISKKTENISELRGVKFIERAGRGQSEPSVGSYLGRQQEHEHSQVKSVSAHWRLETGDWRLVVTTHNTVSYQSLNT